MIELRPYQKEAYEEIRKGFQEADKLMIQLPTGAGKTILFLKYASEQWKKTLVVVPTLDLKTQVLEAAKTFYRDGEVYLHSSSRHMNDRQKRARLWIVTSSSLAYQGTRSVIEEASFDGIIIDECHHAVAPTYREFIDSFEGEAQWLGVTATPSRLDRKNVVEVFENKLVYSKNIKDLIDEKWLCPVEAWRVYTGIKVEGRDYQRDYQPWELKKLDTDSRNELIIRSYLEYCMGRKTIIFCLNVAHSKQICHELSRRNVKAGVVWGSQDRQEREETLKAFREGRLEAICNTQLLTEGFDEPSIDTVLMTRPTQSVALYRQMIGRGLRSFPGKASCHVIELTDNGTRLASLESVLVDDPLWQRFSKTIECEHVRWDEIVERANKFSSSIDFTQCEIKREKISLSVLGAAAPSREKWFHGPMEDYQKHILKDVIPTDWMDEITFEQAAFLIWKEKAKKKYNIGG